VYDHCTDLIAPGTLFHISNKLVQLAATNCTDGSHYNTWAQLLNQMNVDYLSTNWMSVKGLATIVSLWIY